MIMAEERLLVPVELLPVLGALPLLEEGALSV
jgi:hypothetical protein